MASSMRQRLRQWGRKEQASNVLLVFGPAGSGKADPTPLFGAYEEGE